MKEKGVAKMVNGILTGEAIKTSWKKYRKYFLAGAIPTLIFFIALVIFLKVTAAPYTDSDIYVGFDAKEVSKLEVVLDGESRVCAASEDEDEIAAVIDGMREIKLKKNKDVTASDGSLTVIFNLKNGDSESYFFENGSYVKDNKYYLASNTAAFSDAIGNLSVVDETDTTTTSTQNGSSTTTAPKNTGSNSSFDTWGEACVDQYGNVTVAAILGLRGWQLQTLLSQKEYVWDSSVNQYLGSDSRSLGVAKVNRNGDVNWLSEDEIGELYKGGTGSPVAYMDTVVGYNDPLLAIKGNGGLSVEDYEQGNGAFCAVVYDESLTRFLVMAAPNDDGSFDIAVYNDDAVKTGALGYGGGSPTIKDIWPSISGREL